MHLCLSEIPEEIFREYSLSQIQQGGWVYMEIQKGMPGLKQAGRLANDRLVHHLAKYGYTPVALTPSLWRHATRPVTFTLVVDDFGIKYVGNQHLQHLLSALRDLYAISTDVTGTHFLGLTLAWDYDLGTVAISMPGYVQAALTRFQHALPSCRQASPHTWMKMG